MAFYLGLDAGGTRTEGALSDEHGILARAGSGSIKVIRVAPEEAARTLQALLGQLTAEAGVALGDVRAACVGIAGNTVAGVNGWVKSALEPQLQGTLEVCGDTDIALDAAFRGGSGVLVISGTGSNILGRSTKGVSVHVGGWGPILGDEGSGYWIGHQALRAALRARDRDGAGALLNAMTAHWNAGTLDELIAIAHGWPPPDFAALARLVVAAADAGDALALSILRRGGELLGEDAGVALDKVRALEDGVGHGRLAFTGSVLRHVGLLRETMIAEVQRTRPWVEVLPEAVDPVEGALWRARNRAGAAQ